MNIKLFSNGIFLRKIEFDGNYNLDNWDGANWWSLEAWSYKEIKKISLLLFLEIAHKDTQTYAEVISTETIRKIISKYNKNYLKKMILKY